MQTTENLFIGLFSSEERNRESSFYAQARSFPPALEGALGHQKKR